MIERLNTDFVSYHFLVDDAQILSKYSKQLRPQQMTNVGFDITNQEFSSAMYRIKIQPFRDNENGKRDLDLGSQVIWIGKLENVHLVMLFRL